MLLDDLDQIADGYPALIGQQVRQQLGQGLADARGVVCPAGIFRRQTGYMPHLTVGAACQPGIRQLLDLSPARRLQPASRLIAVGQRLAAGQARSSRPLLATPSMKESRLSSWRSRRGAMTAAASGAKSSPATLAARACSEASSDAISSTMAVSARLIASTESISPSLRHCFRRQAWIVFQRFVARLVQRQDGDENRWAHR